MAFPGMKSGTFTLVALGVLLACHPCWAQSETEPPAHEGRVLVKYAQGQQRGARGLNGFEVFPLLEGEVVDNVVETLLQQEDVLFAEPDYRVEALVVPNDPRVDKQWALTAIHAPAAWDVSTGSADVTVCVLDTGIDYNHVELAGNMHPLLGYNAITNTIDPMDDQGHGTHCAGIIGAAGNNTMGVAGINWKTRMLACKFLDSNGGGYLSQLLSCLDYCLQNNATISSNSYSITGLNRHSSILRDAIEQAAEKDHLFIAAAGNTAQNNDEDENPGFPAAFATDNMISVAAVWQRAGDPANDDSLSLAPYSNYGNVTTHIGAPGTSIMSTWPGNMLSYLSGTSMAAPHVAGAAALLRGATGGRLRNSVIRQVLLETARPVSSLTGMVSTGAILDLDAAMKRAMELAPFDPPPPPSPRPPPPSPRPSPPPPSPRPPPPTRSPPPTPKPVSSPPPPSPRPLPRKRSSPPPPRKVKRRDSVAFNITMEGTSCVDFRMRAFSVYAWAIRSAAGAGALRDVKYTCRSPALSAQERSLQVTFTATVKRADEAETVFFAINRALESGALRLKVAERLEKRFAVVKFRPPVLI